MEHSDEILMAQIQQGDDDAIDALIVKYERLLRAIINGQGITHPAWDSRAHGEVAELLFSC